MFDPKFMQEAILESQNGMRSKAGGPFGCVIVKDGKVVGRGHNLVTSTNDPTAHAEIVAIRDACRNLGDFQLTGCEIYTSCEPCPMCLGAIYWARPEKVYFGNTRKDAAAIGFDDDHIYQEINIAPEKREIPMENQYRNECLTAFKEWMNLQGKEMY